MRELTNAAERTAARQPVRRALPLLCLALAGALAPVPAHAASFVCTDASPADEAAVCRTQALSDLDVRLATLYGVVLKLVGMGVRADLQDQQTAFLKARATCGADATCIAALYEQRIASLEKVVDDIAARGPY